MKVNRDPSSMRRLARKDEKRELTVATAVLRETNGRDLGIIALPGFFKSFVRTQLVWKWSFVVQC